jgi:hypothetical protein
MKKKLDRLRLDFLAGSVEPVKNRLMDRRRLATITVNRQKQRMGSISLFFMSQQLKQQQQQQEQNSILTRIQRWQPYLRIVRERSN